MVIRTLVVSVIMSLMPTVAFADYGQVESSAEPAAPASAVQIVERGGTRYCCRSCRQHHGSVHKTHRKQTPQWVSFVQTNTKLRF